MATGIRLFLDGDEIDCDRYGNVRTNLGGFTPLTQGRPHTATLDVYADWADPLSQVTECTIVATTNKPAVGSAPSYVYVGSTTWEKVIFQGTIGSRFGTGPSSFKPNVITFNFVGDDSNMLQRTGNATANNASGYAGLLQAICTEHGYANTGISGNFLTDTPRPIDRPAQDNTNNGQWLTPAGAAEGVWPYFTWNWDGSTVPAPIVWQPSYYTPYLGVTPNNINVRHGWTLDWQETGLAVADFVAKVVVKSPDLPTVHFMDYEWEVNTTAPPGSQHINADDADDTLVTKLWIDYDDRHGDDKTNWIDGVREKDEITISKTSGGPHSVFKVTGYRVDLGGYARIPVNRVEGPATYVFPADNQNTDVRFVHPAGNDKKGSAALTDAAKRRQCGERSKEISTYLTTDADCQTAAEKLRDRLNDPTRNTSHRVGGTVDAYRRLLVKHLAAEPGCLAVPDNDAAQWLFADVGHMITWYTPTATAALAWPAAADAIEAEILEAIGASTYSTKLSVIAGTDHTWSAKGGWSVYHEILPQEDVY